MMARCAIGLASLLGCATPYQQSGMRGGYSEQNVGGNRWVIQVGVNSYTSMGTAMTYGYRRASEICPNGYDVTDGVKNQSDRYQTQGDTVVNAPASYVTLVVDCKESTVETLARQESESPPTSATWWCSHLEKIGDGPRHSSCARTAKQCRRFREKMSKAGFGSSECEERSSASCYTFRDQAGDLADDCSTTTVACQAQIDYRKSTGSDVASECETR